MTGDKFNIRTNSWYKLNGATPGTPVNPLTDLLAALTGSVGSITSTHGGATVAELQSSGVLTPGATSFLNSQTPDVNKPKAYVNWILFDEQFKYVSPPPIGGGAGGGSGFEQVGNDQEFKTHLRNGLSIDKSGYLYVYVSNETPNIDVFFDNLQVTHVRGALLETNEYYAGGLQMRNISYRSLKSDYAENKRMFNKGSELQNKEFSDGSGLELYSTNFRSLDPQLGRWWQIDPKPDYAQSLYSAMGNNPILYNDPLGDTARIHFRTGFLGLGKKQSVDYNNGSVTNKDGTAYTGKVKGFLKKTLEGLDNLRAGGANGNQLVSDIQSSTQTVNITKGDNSFSSNDTKTGMTNVVRWKPGNTSGGPDAALKQSRPAFIGLGHELAHSWDQVFDGRIDYTAWYTPTGATIPVTRAEIFSTHIENLIRAENGVNLRVFYSLSTNAAGVTIGEGQILTPGTRQNANTITANGLSLINPIY